MLCLGIDTSNYTTSAALYNSESGEIISEKRLLPVAKGGCGLRQSDAVFHHTRAIGEIVSLAAKKTAGSIGCVCASVSPRRAEGSYMPAFLVGKNVGLSIASAMRLPFYECSHQEGHIVAAAYSAGAKCLLENDFYAFHVSGGTTEALLINKAKPLFDEQIAFKTLDLNAGQLIDRVGVMLSMQFPCGGELDRLAQKSIKEYKIKPAVKDGNCSLSGIQNKCERLFKDGESPCDIAKFAIESVSAAICAMTDSLLLRYGKKPVLYAGGVMCNSIIRKNLSIKYDNIYFAKPEFSSDNAAGAAIIGTLFSKGELNGSHNSITA